MGCWTADIGDDCTTGQSYQLRHDNRFDRHSPHRDAKTGSENKLLALHSVAEQPFRCGQPYLRSPARPGNAPREIRAPTVQTDHKALNLGAGLLDGSCLGCHRVVTISVGPAATRGRSGRKLCAGGGGTLSVAKVLMYECNRHAALAHRGGDSFHRAEPHVPTREDAWDAGLEEIRVALMRPAIRCTHVGPGEDVAA